MIATGFGQFQEKTHGRVAPSRIESKTYPLRAGDAVPLAKKASYGGDGKPADPDLQAMLRKDTKTRRNDFIRVFLDYLAVDVAEDTPVLVLIVGTISMRLILHAYGQSESIKAS